MNKDKRNDTQGANKQSKPIVEKIISWKDVGIRIATITKRY